MGNAERVPAVPTDNEFPASGKSITFGWLFTGAIFLNAFLLFLVQPLIAKRILPTFGGSPVVWNACLLFFQIVLLVGYLYAHSVTRRLDSGRQSWLHVAVLIAGAACLPIRLPQWLVEVYRHALETNPSSFLAQPTPMVLAILLVSVGPTFFALSAGAPLLQRWFADSRQLGAKSPYFLYSASNAGSLLALLCYPFFVEARFTARQASLIWSLIYAALVATFLACGAVARHSPQLRSGSPKLEVIVSASWNQRLTWLALAAGPSAALLGITTYLTTNVAPMPLLWVAPLGLYLLTFIIAFSKRFTYSDRLFRPLAAAALFLSVTWFSLGLFTPILRVVPLHLACFFVVALACHGRASALKPEASGLTEFYLWISIGGALGGFFSAIVAPLIFRELFEVPVALGFCALALTVGKERCNRQVLISALAIATLIAITLGMARLAWHGDAVRYKYIWLAIAGLMLVMSLKKPILHGLICGAFVLAAIVTQYAGYREPMHLSRSFFGVHRVHALGVGYVHRLVHGNTVHGSQDSRNPKLALAYYSPMSGVGRVFRVLGNENRFDRIAIVGLGIGTLMSYGRTGQTMDLYELDPDVAQIAADPALFTYWRDCKATKRLLLGDARLRLGEAKPEAYGLLVLDAFASDAVPVHLLTREAFDLYASSIRPDGILAFHISNKYMKLDPILAALAASHGFKAWLVDTSSLMSQREHPEVMASRWVLLSKREANLGSLLRDPVVQPLHAAQVREWTDDYSDVLAAMQFRSAVPEE